MKAVIIVECHASVWEGQIIFAICVCVFMSLIRSSEGLAVTHSCRLWSSLQFPKQPECLKVIGLKDAWVLDSAWTNIHTSSVAIFLHHSSLSRNFCNVIWFCHLIFSRWILLQKFDRPCACCGTKAHRVWRQNFPLASYSCKKWPVGSRFEEAILHLKFRHLFLHAQSTWICVCGNSRTCS